MKHYIGFVKIILILYYKQIILYPKQFIEDNQELLSEAMYGMGCR